MPFFKTQNKFCQAGTSYWFSSGYEPEAYYLFARMSMTPSTELKRLISLTIKRLKGADIWNYLDCYQSYNLHTSQASLLNWKQDKYNATIINSPTWQKYVGFTGDGLTNYINTGFNPYNTGALFSQNNALFGVTTTGSDITYGAHGVRAPYVPNYNTWIARASFNMYFALNSGWTNIFSNYFNKHIVLERNNSTSFTLYVDKDSSTRNIGTTEVLNYNLYVLAENNIGNAENLSTETAKQFFVGNYLGASKVEEFQDIINNFNYHVQFIRK